MSVIRAGILVFCVVASLFGLVGCGGDGVSEQAGGRDEDRAFAIVATTGMVADIARQVVGDRGEVIALMGEGVDPHLYKPTRSDVAKIFNADVIFYSGLLLEGRMSDVFIKAASEGRPVYAVTQLIDEEYLLTLENYPEHPDPHVWMDVSAWSQCVGVIAKKMSAFDPAHAEAYQQRATAYQAKLDELDQQVRAWMASIPEEQRVLITAHDAFNYFGRAYGLNVRGIQGLSTESEAGLSDIRKLIDFIVEKKITAVFVESSVSDKNVRALIEGAEARNHAVRVGGELFSDAMGKAGTHEGTYLGMIEHNARTIAKALGGQVTD